MAASADRRRKLLRDDTRKPGSRPVPAASAPTRRRGRAYSPEARTDNQPRITDFIPQRAFTLWLWFLGGCVGWALINALFLARTEWWESPVTEPLRLAGTGTLARWLASVTLLLACIAATMIFHLRRYKLDDYQGRYRAWRWTAILMAVASLDAATNLHQLVVAGLAMASASIRNTKPELVWLTMWYGAGILVWARIWKELWVSRLASLLAFLALCSYAAGTMVFLGKWGGPDGALRDMATFALAQLGHHLSLLGLLVYLRYVYLHAQNALPVRGIKKRPTRVTAAEAEADEEVADEAETERTKPRDSGSSREGRRDTESRDDYEDGEDSASKSERRRQRKEQRHYRAA